MKKVRTKWWTILAVCTAGTLTQVQAGGCAEYGLEFLLNGLNVCSIVNCTDSAFFNFCEPAVLLWDCL